MKNNFDNPEDIQKMQQEAVRRVHEMQKRAKQSLAAEQNYLKLKEEEKQKNKNTKNPDIIEQAKITQGIQTVNNSIKNTNSNQKSFEPKNNFDFLTAFLNDREKTLILLLILLLIDESCELSLIVALLYLII